MPSGVVLAGTLLSLGGVRWISCYGYRNLAFQIGCFRFEPYAIRSVV